jgi:hypothetical protein
VTVPSTSLAASRRSVIRGVALLVAAAAAFGVLRLTYGQRSAYVHVRWSPTVDGAARMEMERTHSLTRGELREGTTWGYYVTDVSTANLRALVESPAVDDTHNIHRTAFRIWRTAPRGDYLGPRPHWVASTLELLIRGCLGLGAVMLAAGAFKAWRSRPAPPSLRPGTGQAPVSS